MAGTQTKNGFAFHLGWPESEFTTEILALMPEFKIRQDKRIEIPIKGKITYDIGNREVIADVKYDKD